MAAAAAPSPDPLYLTWADRYETAFGTFINAAPNGIHAAQDLELSFTVWKSRVDTKPYAELLDALTNAPEIKWNRDILGSASGWLQQQLQQDIPVDEFFDYVAGPSGSFLWYLRHSVTPRSLPSQLRVLRRIEREVEREAWKTKYAGECLGVAAVVGARVMHTRKGRNPIAQSEKTAASASSQTKKRKRNDGDATNGHAVHATPLAFDSPLSRLNRDLPANILALPTPSLSSRRKEPAALAVDDGISGLELFYEEPFITAFRQPILALWTNCLYMLVAPEKRLTPTFLYSLPGQDMERFGKFKAKTYANSVEHFLAHGARKSSVLFCWGPTNIWASCIPLQSPSGVKRGVFSAASQPRGADTSVVSAGDSETLIVASPDESGAAPTLEKMISSSSKVLVVKEQNGSYTAAISTGPHVVPMTHPLPDHTASKTKRTKVVPKTPNGGPTVQQGSAGPEGMCPVGEVHSKWRCNIRKMLVKCLPFYTGSLGFLYTFETPPDATGPWPGAKWHGLMTVIFCAPELALEVAWACPSYPMFPRLGGIELTSPIDEQARKAFCNWSQMTQFPPVHFFITQMPSFDADPTVHVAVEIMWSPAHGFKSEVAFESGNLHSLIPTGIVCNPEEACVTTGSAPLLPYTPTHHAYCRVVYVSHRGGLQMALYYVLNKQRGKNQLPIATLFSGKIHSDAQLLDLKLLNGMEVPCHSADVPGKSAFRVISPVGVSWDGRGIFVAHAHDEFLILQTQPKYLASKRAFQVDVANLASKNDKALVESTAGADFVAASAQTLGRSWVLVLVECIHSGSSDGVIEFAVIIASQTSGAPTAAIDRHLAPNPEAGWAVKRNSKRPSGSFSVPVKDLPELSCVRKGRRGIQTLVHIEWIVASNRQQRVESYLAEPVMIADPRGKNIRARISLGSSQYETAVINLE